MLLLLALAVIFLSFPETVVSTPALSIQPKISLREVDKTTRKELEVLSDSDIDMDIVLEEIKLQGKKIELECRAPYPVEWIYKGDGISNLQVSTGVNTVHGILSESREFTSTGTIGFSRNPLEIDTGNYSCYSLENANTVFTSYYLYIAGDNLFIQTKEQTVLYTEGEKVLRIPCSVSHPDVKLSLQKLMNGIAEFPLNESVSYDPKSGFLLYTPDIPDVEGTYLCNAAFDGNNSSERINVVKHNAILTCTEGPCVECSSSECGENTSCKVFNGKAKCSCLPGYTGNPSYACFDANYNDECRRICGPNTICDYHTNFKEIRCQCSTGFYGDPYYGCIKAYLSRHL